MDNILVQSHMCMGLTSVDCWFSIVQNPQYSVVLSLLVICEIAAGIAAAVKRNEVSCY